MTNWMTTAGIAMIAGGIATLIVFRKIIWTGGNRRTEGAPVRSPRERKGSRRGEPARVRPVLPAQAGAPDISGSQQAADILAGLAASDQVEAADSLAGLAASDEAEAADILAGLVASDEAEATAGKRRQAGDKRSGGLASLGLADDDDPIDQDDASAEVDRRRRPRGGPMDMDDLRRQLRDALEDLKRERRDEPEPAAGSDLREAGHGETEQRRLAQAVLARADAGTREGARFDTASGQLVPPVYGGTAPPAKATTTRPADVLGDRVDGWVRPQYGAPEGPTGDYWKPVPDAPYADDSSAYGWPVPVDRLPVAPAYPAPAGRAIEESEPTAVVPQWPPARPSDRIEVPRTWSVRRWDTDTVGRDIWRNHNVAEVSRRRPSPRPNAPADVHSTVYVSRHAAEPS